MNECKNCDVIMNIKITYKGNSLREFLICMEDIIMDSDGYETMTCDSAFHSKYDRLEYTIYGHMRPMKRLELRGKIQALAREFGEMSMEFDIDPCKNCPCCGLNT